MAMSNPAGLMEDIPPLGSESALETLEEAHHPTYDPLKAHWAGREYRVVLSQGHNCGPEGFGLDNHGMAMMFGSAPTVPQTSAAYRNVPKPKLERPITVAYAPDAATLFEALRL